MNEQNIKKLTKNKSRNQLFKTMEDNSKSHALVKNDTSRQKTIQNIMNSNFSKNKFFLYYHSNRKNTLYCKMKRSFHEMHVSRVLNLVCGEK